MASIQAQIARAIVRKQLAGWADGTVEEQRARQTASTRFLALPKGVLSSQGKLAELPVWLFAPKGMTTSSNSASNTADQAAELANSSFGADLRQLAGERGPVLLYLHGGGYALGSVKGYRDLLGRMVLASHGSVVAPEYRLAPEHPFPAALEDACVVYTLLLGLGISPSRIFLAGDSAGGGLAVAAALRLRDSGQAAPAGLVLFSPWLDLTLQGPSLHKKADVDPYLYEAALRRCAVWYAGTAVQHPYVSPIFADLRGLPPILLQCGRDEILLDDARRFTCLGRRSGVQIKLEVSSGLFHVYQLFPFLPESKAALMRVSAFIASLLEPG